MSTTHSGLTQIKHKVSQELGIPLAPTYNGHLLTLDAGSIGGNITRRLVQIAEQTISGESSFCFFEHEPGEGGDGPGTGPGGGGAGGGCAPAPNPMGGGEQGGGPYGT